MVMATYYIYPQTSSISTSVVQSPREVLKSSRREEGGTGKERHRIVFGCYVREHGPDLLRSRRRIDLGR